MAIEPKLVLCYGPSDRELAQSLTSEMRQYKIDCYNYIVKPGEDRMGSELPHIFRARLFIAIISSEIMWRRLVFEEILMVRRLSGILGSRLRCVYIATPSLIESFPLPAPGHCIDPIHADGPKGIAMQLIDFMGSDLVEQCQKAWDINKNLYPGKWND